jgi:hypothetical protein
MQWGSLRRIIATVDPNINDFLNVRLYRSVILNLFGVESNFFPCKIFILFTLRLWRRRRPPPPSYYASECLRSRI